MKIKFLGGVGTVTGSMYLIRTNRQNILLECGLYQGKRYESYQRNRKLALDIHRLSAVILSHAHIDHSGNLPTLVKNGYDRNIYATHATVDLCGAMLPDSGRIHEADVAYANKKRARQKQALFEPLYTEKDALKTLPHFVGLGYNRTIELARDVRLTFLDAGHILGSAMVLLETVEDGFTRRLLFTGDLGQPDLPIVYDPTPLPPVDYLMIESTYGNREHPPIRENQRLLGELVHKVVRRGGRIVIPAFAVGRTQDIVYDLHQLTHAGLLPDIPIYVDSPLAVNITEIFRLHPNCFDQETRDFMAASGAQDPFGFYRLRYVRSLEESKSLNELREPHIIISASGMAEAGRVQHHLKYTITDPRNAVLITGWQAPNTLGRHLADKAEGKYADGQLYVRIYGDEFPVNAEVHTLYGYSAHADRQHLLNWAAPGAEHVKRAFVVHGDPEPAQSLAEGLRDLGYPRVDVPQRDDKIVL